MPGRVLHLIERPLEAFRSRRCLRRSAPSPIRSSVCLGECGRLTFCRGMVLGVGAEEFLLPLPVRVPSAAVGGRRPRWIPREELEGCG